MANMTIRELMLAKSAATATFSRSALPEQQVPILDKRGNPLKDPNTGQVLKQGKLQLDLRGPNNQLLAWILLPEGTPTPKNLVEPAAGDITPLLGMEIRTTSNDGRNFAVREKKEAKGLSLASILESDAPATASAPASGLKKRARK